MHWEAILQCALCSGDLRWRALCARPWLSHVGFKPLLTTLGGSLARETYSTDKAGGYCQFLYYRTLFLLNKLSLLRKTTGKLGHNKLIELQGNSHYLKIIQIPATRINPLQYHKALTQNNSIKYSTDSQNRCRWDHSLCVIVKLLQANAAFPD